MKNKDGFAITMIAITIFVIGCVSGAFIINLIDNRTDYTIQDICSSCSSVYGEKDYKTINMTQFLDTVNKNCGGTYFTKWYKETEYKIALNSCNSEGYCKLIRKNLSCIYGSD